MWPHGMKRIRRIRIKIKIKIKLKWLLSIEWINSLENFFILRSFFQRSLKSLALVKIFHLCLISITSYNIGPQKIKFIPVYFCAMYLENIMLPLVLLVPLVPLVLLVPLVSLVPLVPLVPLLDLLYSLPECP